MRETRKKSPYLPAKVTLPQLFTSFWICVLPRIEKLTTFLPDLIRWSVQDWHLNKVILRGVITSSISTRWQQKNLESVNPEIRCVNNSRWEGGAALFRLILFLFFAFTWTIKQFQDCSPLFLDSNLKKMSCSKNCRLNFKRKSFRVYVCISGQLTATVPFGAAHTYRAQIREYPPGRRFGAFYPTFKFDEIAPNHSPKKSFGDRRELPVAFQKSDFQSIILCSTLLNNAFLLTYF